MARIAIVDDDDIIVNLYSAALKRSGYDVHGFDDGAGLMQFLDASAVDLVISDIFMRDKEGIETIAAVKTRFPDLPVIAISVSDFALRKAQSSGADYTMRKPINVEVLRREVEKILAAHRKS